MVSEERWLSRSLRKGRKGSGGGKKAKVCQITENQWQQVLWTAEFIGHFLESFAFWNHVKIRIEL